MRATTVSLSNMSKQAAGVFFYSKNTYRYLYLLRSDQRNPTWSIPGGGIEDGETLLEGISRECMEEMSFDISELKLIPIQKFVNNNFTYHTFFCEVEDEFIPLLNNEHDGYAWVRSGLYPKPLHPGLFSTINIDIVIEKLNSLR
jgi:8-oxo-dGTP pyrophosphatase MutT (NUDIX family)